MANSKNEYSEFGKHLRNQRKLKYGDMKAFSQATGISSKDLYGYESGRTFPPIEKFVKICQCLDKSATYMLSPILKLDDTEHEIMLLIEDTDIKDMIRDKELSSLIKFTFLGFQILYQTKRHFNHEGDIVDYLNVLKNKLFFEGQLRKLQ